MSVRSSSETLLTASRICAQLLSDFLNFSVGDLQSGELFYVQNVVSADRHRPRSLARRDAGSRALTAMALAFF